MWGPASPEGHLLLYTPGFFLLKKSCFVCVDRFNKAKSDLDKAEKKVHQLETRNNELNASIHQLKADLARALDDKKV